MTLTATRQTSDPTKKVPTRRMNFEESIRELPKHFAQDGDLIASHVIMAPCRPYSPTGRTTSCGRCVTIETGSATRR